MSQVDLRQETIPASGQIVLAGGNFLFINSTSASLSVVLRGGGTTESMATGFAALRVKRVAQWDRATITGAPGGVVSFFFGQAEHREDSTEIESVIATISGVTAIAEQPSSGMTDTADVTQASGTQTVISANLSRRRMIIGCRSDSTNPIRVSTAGGATRGIEISPGTYERFPTTGALTVRNDNTFGGAGNAFWYAEEE